MNSDSNYTSELFRIISGALRLDTLKVRNYASFLADKFEANGDDGSANRLRKLLSETDNELHPVSISSKAPPVDSETRFPLVEIVNLNEVSEIPLIIPAEQRDVLNEFISIAKSHAQFETEGVNSPNALLLYGPPGCGKSRLAREIARELGLKLYIARLDGVISSYLGSTSKNIRAIFEFAASTPCVLFLDEFDAIAKLRDDAQELGELKRVVNSFIQNLDSVGAQSVIIAATNHHQLLDPAVWRRFSYRLELSYPDNQQRIKMWDTFLKPHGFSSHELAILGDLSEGFSGGDIREVCFRIKRQNIVSKKHPTVRDAFIGLKRLALGDQEAMKFLSALKHDNDHTIARRLKERNPKLYSHANLALILDVSKATAHRWSKKESVMNG